RLWKVCLQRFANRTGLDETVCHYPPGTSKGNKVEHRLFSDLSMNWRGQPLTTYTTVIERIGHTTTKPGLHATAAVDTRQYATKVKVPDDQIEAVRLDRPSFHPDWNYTIRHRV